MSKACPDGRLLQSPDGVLLRDLRIGVPGPADLARRRHHLRSVRPAGSAGTDFGDAPDHGYQTLLASDGARHTIVPGVFLGRTVDAESDGRPGAAATGDDNTGADEDGIVFTSTLHAGHEATLDVTASTEGYLNAWVDFDGDGRFDGRDEAIFADQALRAGRQPAQFPDSPSPPSPVGRTRDSGSTREDLLSSFGPAEDGEVEDYRIQIVASHDSKTVSGASQLTWSQPPSPATDGQDNAFQAGGVHLGSPPARNRRRRLAARGRSAPHRHPLVGHVRRMDRVLSAVGPAAGVPHRHLDGCARSAAVRPRHVRPSGHADLGNLLHELGLGGLRQRGFDRPATSRTDVLPVQPSALAGSLVRGRSERLDQGRAGSKVVLAEHFGLVRSDRAGPAHMWTWKTRPTATGAAGTSLQTIVPASTDSSWPPVLGSQWETGNRHPRSPVQPDGHGLPAHHVRAPGVQTRASARPAPPRRSIHGSWPLLAANWLHLRAITPRITAGRRVFVAPRSTTRSLCPARTRDYCTFGAPRIFFRNSVTSVTRCGT